MSINPITMQIRAKVQEILQDGKDHDILELVLACSSIITPELAAHAYVQETSSESDYRKTRPLSEKIYNGRYSALRRAIRPLVQRGELIRTGRHQQTTYRRRSDV